MGILMALALLIAGLWRGNSEDQKIALVTLVAAAVLAIALYLTGEPAASAVRASPEFMDSLLERHRSVAALAMAGCSVLGIVAFAGLFLFQGRTIARWFGLAILLGAVIVGLLLSWTATLGGQIRHSEIRAAMRDAPTASR